MKKLLLGTMLLALVIVVPTPTMADVNISIGIPLPPAIVFHGPIEVVVIPDTYIYDVYAVPDIEVDIFFSRGWWWRPWEGRWYRSRYHDRGWAYYRYIPDFYYDIDSGWRGFYRDRHWRGHRWDYRRIPHHQLEQNWRSWNSSRYWQRERKWNVEKYQPLPPQRQQEMRRQRQHEYAGRPDVRRHEQWKKEQQRQPRLQQPRQEQRQRQREVQQPRQEQRQRQREVQQPRQQQQQRQREIQQQQSRPQEKTEGRGR
jgi:hypothetical protein